MNNGREGVLAGHFVEHLEGILEFGDTMSILNARQLGLSISCIWMMEVIIMMIPTRSKEGRIWES